MSTTLTGPTRADAPSAGDRGLPWGWWSAGTALLAGGLVLGGVLMHVGPVSTGELALDQMLAPHRVAALVSACLAIHIFFGPVVAPAALAVAGLVVWLRNRAAAVTLVVVTALGWLSVGLGKLAYHRARPPFDAVHALVRESKPDGFPSGHAAFAFALVFGIALALRVAGRRTWPTWVIGLPVAVVVALSRVYAGVHYLGDVVAAPLFTTGTVALLIAVWRTIPAADRSTTLARITSAGRTGS